jgi:hypothetical protein
VNISPLTTCCRAVRGMSPPGRTVCWRARHVTHAKETALLNRRGCHSASVQASRGGRSSPPLPHTAWRAGVRLSVTPTGTCPLGRNMACVTGNHHVDGDRCVPCTPCRVRFIRRFLTVGKNEMGVCFWEADGRHNRSVSSDASHCGVWPDGKRNMACVVAKPHAHTRYVCIT